MALKPVASILVNGLVPLPQHVVFSRFYSTLELRDALLTCYRALVNDHSPSGLRVYVRPDDSDVYQDSFMRIARREDGSFQPTLILLGTRLGIDRVTPVYREAVKAALCLPQSVGIAGYVSCLPPH